MFYVDYISNKKKKERKKKRKGVPRCGVGKVRGIILEKLLSKPKPAGQQEGFRWGGGGEGHSAHTCCREASRVCGLAALCPWLGTPSTPCSTHTLIPPACGTLRHAFILGPSVIPLGSSYTQSRYKVFALCSYNVLFILHSSSCHMLQRQPSLAVFPTRLQTLRKQGLCPTHVLYTQCLVKGRH